MGNIPILLFGSHQDTSGDKLAEALLFFPMQNAFLLHLYFSPFIEPAGIDEAYLDVTGFESIHGSIQQMAVFMKGRIRSELGLSASIGIASCKVVAKVASDFSKPDGLIEVATGEERDFLAPLPELSHLRRLHTVF